MPNTQLSSVGLSPGSEAGKVRLYNAAKAYYGDLTTSPTLSANRTWYMPSGDSGTVLLDSTVGDLLLDRNPRVLYVSTAGNDTDGNGSIGYPYASVTKAMAVMSGTTVIMLGPGSYAAATVSNSGTDPVDLTPATAVVLVGVPGQTTVTLSGEESGAGVYNVLRISGASGVIFARTGTGNRHAVCGLDRMIGLRDCELANSDGSRKLVVFGRTGESAAVRGLKVSGSAPAMIELYNVWLQDCWLDGLAAFNVLQWTGEAANRISNSWIGIGTSGALRIEGLASANDLWFDGPDVDSFAVTLASADDVAVYRSIQGRLGCASSSNTGGVSLFAWNSASGDVPAVFEGWDVEWTGLFAEPADGGKVMILSRFSGTKEIVLRNCRLVGTCVPVFNSHPNTAIDANRATEDRPLTIDNSYLAMTRGATTGPADVNGALLNYGRGAFRSVGSAYRAVMAASTNAATHYAAVYLSPPNAGTMAGTLVNDRYEVTLPAGAVTVGGATSNEKAVINVQNTYTTMTVRFVNPSISVDGNEDSVFAGHGTPYTTVEGIVASNAAITYENTPAGSYQAVRGDWAVSGATTLSGALTLGSTVTAGSLTAGITPTSMVGRDSSNVVGTVTSIPDSLVTNALTIVSGSIEDTWIGQSTPGRGSFTRLSTSDITTLCDASGDTLTINSGAPTAPNLSTGTDAHFVTLDGSNVVRKQAVGMGTDASPFQLDIYDSVLVGTHSLTFKNGLLTNYEFNP